MAKDIRKGELVRVKVAGSYRGQECQVIKIEHDTEHYHRTARDRTWYLLDTRYPGRHWSKPCWFERHEIEPVIPEESRGVV